MYPCTICIHRWSSYCSRWIVWFCQDEMKMERLVKRNTEIETCCNNIKLLTEMLNHYSPSSPSQDKELMKVGSTCKCNIHVIYMTIQTCTCARLVNGNFNSLWTVAWIPMYLWQHGIILISLECVREREGLRYELKFPSIRLVLVHVCIAR